MQAGGAEQTEDETPLTVKVVGCLGGDVRPVR